MRILISKYRYFFVSLLVLFGGVFLIYGIKLFSNADAGEDITISTNTTWASGTYTYQDITITNNAILTLSGTYTDNTDGIGVTINARNVTVETGSFISATATGYAGCAGPGAGTSGDLVGRGGSYGGRGGQSLTDLTYGSALNPSNLGSGGCAYQSDAAKSGKGGGAINIIASGQVSVAGSIVANGSNGLAKTGGYSTGGGSGGTININTTSITGAGTISANGGNGYNNGGVGGGGRISIFYSSGSLDSMTISASKGITGTVTSATDGTVFPYNTITHDLTLKSSLILKPAEGIDADGNIDSSGNYYFNDLSVTNNATLTLYGYYTTNSDGVGVNLNLSGDLSVASGSTITADGRGYAAQTGSGKGSVINVWGGTGGGYGGTGGTVQWPGYGGTGGAIYGSTLFPEDLGSGGGQTCGGTGGGLIKIAADGDVSIEGTISANGLVGANSGSARGGGGSGGAVYLIGDAFTGSGSITANGGNGTPSGYGGGGGGGRIALFYGSMAIDTDNFTVNAGTDSESRPATNGTIFLYNTTTGDVEVSQDVTFDGNAGVSRDGSKRTDGVYYFNNLTVSNNATVTIAGYYTNDEDGRGVTINLDGGLTVEAGSTITGIGQGHGAQSGPGKGLQGAGNASGGGGSYGGVGGVGAFDGTPGSVYGDTEKYYPYFLGSGGGNCNGGTGGAGGSALSIRSLGDVVIAGDIDLSGANGGAGTSTFGSGGGSGGSIFLSGNNFSGAGNIKANGGNGGAAADGGGAGGGGRVSIAYFNTFTMNESNVTADGGTGSTTPARDGAVGTVYIRKMDLPSANFDLVNPNNNSTQYTNSIEVDLDPEDPDANAYYESSNGDLTPPFYAQGWHQVSEGKELTEGEGSKTVRAWLKDNNQLISSAVGEATIILDQTNPEISVPTPSGNTTLSTTTISGTVSDNLSGIASLTVQAVTLESPIILFNPYGQEVTVNGDGTFSVTIALSVGDNQVTFTATDGAGNTSTESLAVTRDSVSNDSETIGDDSDQDTNPDTSETVTGTNGNSNDSTTTTENDESISDNASDSDQVNDNGLLEQTRDAIRTIGGCLLGNCPSKTKTAVTYFFFGAAAIGAIGYFLFIVLFKKKKRKK